ncbi:hypothetical protein [Thioalkalivibrio sp. ALE19]|uniref:hypothetical protein n=1 Tax=Thioalkalivibrio sp. ALE19 TaxID=1266909 RepID=UPI0004913892|nr:hypothetical protein [Thioalkalivibrio sp. ALE19]
MEDVRETLEAWRTMPVETDQEAPNVGASSPDAETPEPVPQRLLVQAPSILKRFPASIPAHVPPEHMEPI